MPRSRLAQAALACCLFSSMQSGAVAATPRHVYVADKANNAIVIFPAGVANPQPAGTITSGIDTPADVFVDSAGTLYVANRTAVTEYAAGSSTPKLTIPLGPIITAVALTVGPDATLYVAAEVTSQRTSIFEFLPGATKPARVVPVPNTSVSPVGGIAVSKENLLYVNEAVAAGIFQVFVYLPKRSMPLRSFSIGQYASGAVHIVRDRIFVGDPLAYALESESLPARAPYDIESFPVFASGDFFAFDEPDGLVYTVSHGTQTLQVYDIKQRRLIWFRNGFESGVAVDPPSP